MPITDVEIETIEGEDLVGLRPADFGTRFSAFMVDASLLFAAQWVVFIVLSRQLQAVGMTSTEPCTADPLRLCEGPSPTLWTILLLILAASTIGYYVFFESRYGATPGKRWLGLEVVRDDGSSPIKIAAAVPRAIMRQAFWLSLFFLLEASPLSISVPSILFVALPILAVSGVALGAVAPSGKSLHDIVAGTVVVRSNPIPPSTSEELV